MQAFRKYAAVVSLAAALAATPAMANQTESAEGIFSRLLAFFGVVLNSRFSIPPGAPAEDESRVSIPPGAPVDESRLSTPPG